MASWYKDIGMIPAVITVPAEGRRVRNDGEDEVGDELERGLEGDM